MVEPQRKVSICQRRGANWNIFQFSYFEGITGKSVKISCCLNYERPAKQIFFSEASELLVAIRGLIPRRNTISAVHHKLSYSGRR